MQKNIRRVPLLAIFIAMASILHVVESWIPVPLPVPGMKIGLANIVSITVIVFLGWRDAMRVVFLRVLIGSLLGGTFLGLTFLMSFCGASVSALLMAYIRTKWSDTFSIIGISIAGAVIHNAVQLSVAAIIMSSLSVFWYFPYLVLFAIPVGWFTGLSASYLIEKMSFIRK